MRTAALLERTFPGARVLAARPLEGGVSASMSAADILLADGTRRTVVVRRRPSGLVAEHRVMTLARAAGLPVPEPLWSRDDVLVMAFVDGSARFDRTDVTDLVHRLADQLADIHRIPGDRLEMGFLPRRTDWHREEKLEERVRRIVGRAAPSPDAPSVLLHGDFWPGNVLWRDGTVVAVVDWEDAAVGPALADLAVARLDVLWIFGLDAMRAFTECYLTATSVDPTDLPYWDLSALRRPVGDFAAWAAGYPALGRPDVSEATLRQGHRWFVDEALRALECRQSWV